MTKPQSSHHRGYIEGYYGRLLSWEDREQIIQQLHALGMNSYLYAPKEDLCHRFAWRQDWDATWWQGFQAFTAQAKAHGITVMAGIAPGIDMDFASLDRKDGDTGLLIAKAERLRAHGAAEISLLLDDIDPLFADRRGRFHDEGSAHAALVNLLSDHLGEAVSVTPRIYADEITDGAAGYLDHFAASLNPDSLVFTCGSHIVAPALNFDTTGLARAGIAAARMIAWDNLYANDYCPRRLFLGPWRGGHDAVMLNPTGMPATDGLLLDLMAAGKDGWADALRRHGVPDAFINLAGFFHLPPDPRVEPDTAPLPLHDAPEWLAALDMLLWRWKTPLAREWYPYLMGLRGDILQVKGEMDRLRVSKVYPRLQQHRFSEGA